MTLYPFQSKALDDTAPFTRVAYYFDMGLGKTYIGGEKMKRLAASVNLLICQKSKVDDWMAHFKNYMPLAVPVLNLTDKKELEHYFTYVEKGVPVIGVINYDLIFRRKRLHHLTGFTLMLDESSLIQNPKAERTKAIMKMKPLNVVLLSGTPTAGKYENLWSQLNLLGWKITLEAFEQNYVNWKKIEVGGYVRKVVNKSDPYKNVERLKRKMREHGAVFMKTDEVFDLPAQTVVTVTVPTTSAYRKFQKSSIVDICRESLGEFVLDSDFWGTNEASKITLVGDTALSKRMYSRMLCGQYNADKLRAFQDLCESTNDRLLVFYNFNEELEALRRICTKLERPVSEVNGNCKDLTAYQHEDNSITLIQYKAGAMGLNLQKANKVIYFTLTEEAELFLQSMKRIHRIGQENPCFYYILLCKNSIEDKEILPTLGVRERYTDELFKK